jgi:hypothetical protein
VYVCVCVCVYACMCMYVCVCVYTADSGWCFLDVRHGHKSWTLNFWLFASYYFWIFLAAFMYVYMLWFIFTRLSQVYHIISEAQNRCESIMARRIRGNVLKLTWYPIIIIVCWIPSAVHDLREAFNSDEQTLSTESDYSNLLPVLKGFFTAVAFLSTTRTVGGEAGMGGLHRKHEPCRMGDDSTEENDEGSDFDVDAMREALLYDRYMEGEHDDQRARESTTSSQSLENNNSDSIYTSSSDMHRCSLPERKHMDSIDSF